MYAVTEDYKKAVASNMRDGQALNGQITLTDDTVIDLSNDNLVQGTVTYKAQCVSGSDLGVSDVTAAQLSFWLVSERNLYNAHDLADGTTAAEADSNGWITVTQETANESTVWKTYQPKISTKLKPDTQYALVVEIAEAEITGDAHLEPNGYNGGNDSENSQFISRDGHSPKVELVPGTTVLLVTTQSDVSAENCKYMIRSFVQWNAGSTGRVKFRISVLADTTITADSFTYMPYISPYSLDGARVTMSYGIVIGAAEDGDSIWEWVPLGTFYVTEIERKANYVQLTALDSFVRMDVPIGSTIVSGSPSNILLSCCANAGIAADLSNIGTFPNSELAVSLAENSDVETIRDCVMWICQFLACFGRISRDGVFELVHLHSEPVRTISPDERSGTTTVSDSYEKVTQVTMSVGEHEYTSGTTGHSMSLEENPFFGDLDEDTIQTALDDILAEITQAEYIPMSCALFGDPALMPGDYIILSDTSALAGDPTSLITEVTWTFRGTHSIKAAGSSDLLRTNYSRSGKSLSALKTATETARRLALAANDSAQLLNTALGGNVLIRQTEGERNEILIMDNIDPEKAVKIWRWNMGGLGYSDNCEGADNPIRQYHVAITMDGAVSAEFIKTGLLMSLTGTSWINMDSGAFSFGDGALYYDGTTGELTVGSPDSDITTVYTADRISFQRAGEEIAYISGTENMLFIRHVNVIDTLRIGKFAWLPRESGNLSMLMVEE